MAKHPNWHPRDYKSVAELQADLDQIEAAHSAGTLKVTGEWSAGQNMEHCAKIMRYAFDGFEAGVPWFIKLFGVLVFKPMLGRSHMKPGIKLPAKAASLMPRDEVPIEEGLSTIREQLRRIDAGEKMTHNSPVLGKMSHDQWVLLHLDHCRLHLGFLQYDTVSA
jgi:hypothetical protein